MSREHFLCLPYQSFSFTSSPQLPYTFFKWSTAIFLELLTKYVFLIPIVNIIVDISFVIT